MYDFLVLSEMLNLLVKVKFTPTKYFSRTLRNCLFQFDFHFRFDHFQDQRKPTAFEIGNRTDTNGYGMS